jgi:predicted nucleic acid-binding protein
MSEAADNPGELAMAIADTDVLIDFPAGAVERLLGRGALVTVSSRFELLSGAKSPKREARLRQLLEATPSLRWLTLPRMQRAKFGDCWNGRAIPS